MQADCAGLTAADLSASQEDPDELEEDVGTMSLHCIGWEGRVVDTTSPSVRLVYLLGDAEREGPFDGAYSAVPCRTTSSR